MLTRTSKCTDDTTSSITRHYHLPPPTASSSIEYAPTKPTWLGHASSTASSACSQATIRSPVAGFLTPLQYRFVSDDSDPTSESKELGAVLAAGDCGEGKKKQSLRARQKCPLNTQRIPKRIGFSALQDPRPSDLTLAMACKARTVIGTRYPRFPPGRPPSDFPSPAATSHGTKPKSSAAVFDANLSGIEPP